MKQVLFSLLILTGMATVSCNKDFLERTPKDQQVEETFYKTPQDAYSALVATYSVLNWDGFGNIWLAAEIASDNCFGGGGLADNGQRQVDRFERWDDHGKAAWKKCYYGIFRANVLLQKIEGIDFGSQAALKTRYIGEAHFLRAYFYFDLIRMYGHVPLLTEPIEGDNYYIPQASPDSVYALIASDLKTSASLLTASAQAFSAIPATEYGRVTKWAAEALLGRVFLYYTGYYGKTEIPGACTKQDAITAIDDVINISGHNLLTDYRSLFRASAVSSGVAFGGQNNAEGVFTIQYTNQGLANWDQQNGNRVQVMVGLRGIDRISYYYKGWGSATVSPKLYNAYEAADSIRRKASFMAIAEEGIDFTPSSDQFQYTGYFWKKYTPLVQNKPDDNGGDFQIDNYDNYVVIRFADVLLMGAELNLLSDLGKAQLYYNRVRDRAFKNDITHRKILTGDAAGVKLVLEERRLELALEGMRYWDLLRQGTTAAKQAIDNATGDDFNVTFRAETQGLFAIPQTQIDQSNSTITQNPGWIQ
ncbi:Starch-binding associating with outer membrane [Filimonas lacunae]|uniref:Starch-binding associating with outer membrane n=1 Tax=Filimonas lacunae TaxID=477680 RepID=A0A173MPE6_9BACT|nr:RagB/SusD family nutrient uptake outer membrane protein [Filimonas lacunae]BAV09555.1 RagB/SusD domain protein [Filimonas lacunae]SIS75138.1 Starch-binding associating with outer membrane [Filimonas lacunae]